MADITVTAAAPRDMDELRGLFREYAAWLRVGYCLKDFEAELAGLPGEHAAPAGGLWLARVDGTPAGCVALRPLGTGSCELRRLWLREPFRGLRLGRRLTEVALAGARAAGHRRVELETLDHMAAARHLYAGLGFREIAGTEDQPANVRKLVCNLTQAASA